MNILTRLQFRDERQVSAFIEKRSLIFHGEGGDGLLANKNRFSEYLPQLTRLYEEICENIEIANVKNPSRQRHSKDEQEEQDFFDLEAVAQDGQRKKSEYLKEIERLMEFIEVMENFFNQILDSMKEDRRYLIKFYRERGPMRTREILELINIKSCSKRLQDIQARSRNIATLQSDESLSLSGAKECLKKVKAIDQEIQSLGYFIEKTNDLLKRETEKVEVN